MPERNEIALRQCRFLDDGCLAELFQSFTEAFSDYIVPFALTETQFRNHIKLTAVDLNRTVGCFENGQMIGFSLNGFGDWNGLPTVYDAGTGVLPAYRRQGISRAMFEFMLPEFERHGFKQVVLEVITSNSGAIRLYEGLGFRISRDLLLLQCDARPAFEVEVDPELSIKAIDQPDWRAFKEFWNGEPSWQNSPESIDRSLAMKTTLGAYVNGSCVGYMIFSSRFGRISQLAVAKEARRSGVATALIQAMHEKIEPGFSAQVINIDASLIDATALFKKCGYFERLRQYEMVLEI